MLVGMDCLFLWGFPHEFGQAYRKTGQGASKNIKRHHIEMTALDDGAGDGDRTHEILLGKQAFYH